MASQARPSPAEQSANLRLLADQFSFDVTSAAELMMIDLGTEPDAEVVGCVLAAAEHLEGALGVVASIRRGFV